MPMLCRLVSSRMHVIVCRPRDRPHAFPCGVFLTTNSRTDNHHHPPNTNFHQQRKAHYHLATDHKKEKKNITRRPQTQIRLGPPTPRSHNNPQKQTCRAVPKSPSQSATSPSPTSSTSKCGRRTSATGSESPSNPSQSSSHAPGNAVPLTRTPRKLGRLLRN
jgi:hypothetical protein